MATRINDGRAKAWKATLLKGGRRHAFFGATARDAEAEKAAYKARSQPPIPHFSEGTLDSFAAYVWWPQVAATTKLPTQRRYKSLYDQHIAPALGRMQLADLTLEVLQTFFNDLSAEIPQRKYGPKGEHYSPKTIVLVRGVLSTILALAARTDRIKRNECAWVKVRSAPKKKARRGLSMENAIKVWKCSRGSPFEGPLFAAIVLGLRRGEIMGLRVTDVEPDQVVLRRTRDKAYEGPLKGRAEGDEASIPVPAEVAMKLLSYAQPGAIYVFSRFGKPLHPDALTKAMPRLCALAKVPPMTVHDLRAAFASHLMASGTSSLTVRDALRHGDLATTEIYLNTRPDAVRAAVGQMRRLVE